MNFKDISKTFQELESTTKRLEKILILRDLLLQDKTSQTCEGSRILNKKIVEKDAITIFDIIAGNFQRELDKKKLSISLKTIFQVLSFIGQISQDKIEKSFNKIGDVGEVAIEIYNLKKQQSLMQKELTLKQITTALSQITRIEGTNSNKKKKEILSNLFLNAQTKEEYKFLSRLLINDLRIGCSDGTLKEAMLNSYFPQIIGIHLICEKCLYTNLNLTHCHKCKTKIDIKNQEEIASKKYQVVEIETPKQEKSLLDYEINYEIDPVKFAIRRDRNKQIIKTNYNPRELYNAYLNLFEKKYNLINSYKNISKELDKDLNNIFKAEIILGTPIRSMLGQRAQNTSDAIKVTSLPVIADFKYDGLRTQIHNINGEIKIFTRNLEEITKQFPEIVKFIKKNFPKNNFVIDSESVGFNFDKQTYLPFQELSRRITTKEVETVEHIEIIVRAFDLLYLDNKTLIDKPYKERRQILNKLLLNKPLKQKISFDLEKLKKIK